MSSLLMMDEMVINGEAQKIADLSHQRRVVIPRGLVRQMEMNPLLNGLMPVSLGIFSGAKGRVLEPTDGLDTPIFIYCLRGTGWCEVDGWRREINAGDLLVAPSSQACRSGATGDQSWAVFWFCVTGREVRLFLNELGIVSEGSVISLGDHPQIPALFEDALGYLENGCGPSQLIQASRILGCLISFMISHHHENWWRQPDIRKKIAYCIGYMKRHLDKPLRLNTVATVANLSPSYFNVLFRKETGYTCMDYLTHLRIRQAGQWLGTTDWPVKTIAARLAYEDPLYFSKVFSSIYGLSPKEYRRTCRGGSPEGDYGKYTGLMEGMEPMDERPGLHAVAEFLCE